MVHKYTELANKNKIFSAISGNTDKNFSDRVRSQRAIRGALLHKGDVLFIPFFFGLPVIPSHSWVGSLKGAHPLGNFAVLRRAYGGTWLRCTANGKHDNIHGNTANYASTVRMPFGLTSADNTWARLVFEVLQHNPKINFFVFFDDFLVH